MWCEDRTAAKPINVSRLEALRATGEPRIATACPHCLTMLESARAVSGTDAESVEISDIAEFFASLLPGVIYGRRAAGVFLGKGGRPPLHEESEDRVRRHA